MRYIVFNEAQWEAPSYDCFHGVVRLKYTYTDDTGDTSFGEEFDYFTDPAALAGAEEPKFFLLNEQRIKYEQKRQERQGDMLRLMRVERRKRLREARKAKPEEGGQHG